MKAVISYTIPELPSEQIKLLQQFGLSDHEIQVFTLMVAKQEPLSAQDVASSVMIYPNAVYRIFYNLEQSGLIQLVGRRPIKYQAVAIELALESAFLNHKAKLDHALQLATGTINKPSKQQTYTLIGRERMYEEYVELAGRAKREINVFAIGIAFSDQLYQVQQEAIKRGVYIRHVVQQVKPGNYYIVAKWQRLGVNLRHFQEDRGFHLTVVDQSTAMITFSDPQDTEDRFSLVTHQPFAVKLFQAQFESIWQQAQKVDKYK